VAYWKDSAGDHGELLVPQKTVVGIKKCYDLQSIRKKNFNTARDLLSEWLKQTPSSDWLAFATTSLDKWKSPARLAGLLIRWMGARVPGDSQILEALEAWAKQDRHLLRWEAHQNKRRRGFRREQYRLWATQLSRKYAMILVDGMALPPLLRKPEVEDEVQSEGKLQRETAKLASPGSLREALKLATSKTGCVLSVIDSAYMTRKCHLCGEMEKWNASPTILHTCGKCGKTWDQDLNHCVNMLREPREPPGAATIPSSRSQAPSG
jgi:hypothetical protein